MSTRKNDLAFPRPASFDPQAGRGRNWDTRAEDGMTKREYFAVLILQGLVASNEFYPDTAAASAIEQADKLINELNKQSQCR